MVCVCVNESLGHELHKVRNVVSSIIIKYVLVLNSDVKIV